MAQFDYLKSKGYLKLKIEEGRTQQAIAKFSIDFNFPFNNDLLISEKEFPFSIEEIICDLNERDTINYRKVGINIFKSLPDDIKNCLRTLRKKALEYASHSDSIPYFIIETDFLYIPWEWMVLKTFQGNHLFEEFYTIIKPLLTTDDAPNTNDKEAIAFVYDDYEFLVGELKKRKDNSSDNLINSIPSEALRKEQQLWNHELEVFNKGKTWFKIINREGEFVERLEGEREKDKCDLILYIGHYNYQSETLYITKNEQRENNIPLKWIEVGKHKFLVLTLGACNTAALPKVATGSSDNEHEHILNKFLPYKMLREKKVRSFIGCEYYVRPLITLKFFNNFIAELEKGASLAKAIFNARRETENDFKKLEQTLIQDLNYHHAVSYITSQTDTLASIRIFSQNDNHIFSSYKYEGIELKIIYPALNAPYYEGFHEKEIIPDGFLCCTLYEQIAAFGFGQIERRFKELCSRGCVVLADLSLTAFMNYLYNLKESERKDFVILDSLFLFNVTAELSYNGAILFHSLKLGNELKEVFLKTNQIYHPGTASTIYSLLLYLLSEELQDIKKLKEEIQKNPEKLLPLPNPELLKEVFDRRMFTKQLDDTHPFIIPRQTWITYQGKQLLLCNYLKDQLNEVYEGQWTKHWGNIDIAKMSLNKMGIQMPIPAQVIITKREYVEKYTPLFKEVLTKWREWRKNSRNRNTKSWPEGCPDEGKDLLNIGISEDLKNSMINISQILTEFDKQLVQSPLYLGFSPLSKDNFWDASFDSHAFVSQLNEEIRKIAAELITEMQDLKTRKKHSDLERDLIIAIDLTNFLLKIEISKLENAKKIINVLKEAEIFIDEIWRLKESQINIDTIKNLKEIFEKLRVLTNEEKKNN